MDALRALVMKGCNMLSNLWLIGALFRAGRKTYAEALYEFSYSLLWSILPFVLGALTLYVTTTPSDERDYIALSISTFRNGELLVYTISMLTPILYLVLHDPEQAQKFPHKLPISTLVMLIAVTCAALFALTKAGVIRDGEFVFQFSVALTLVALFVRYLALIYHRLRMPDTSEIDLRAPEVSFIQQYRSHVGDPSDQTTRPAVDFAKAFEQHLENPQ